MDVKVKMNDLESLAEGELWKRLRFICEIDKLKTVLRQTLNYHEKRHENSAEHSWHLALMVLVLSDCATDPINLERAMKMALIHDIVEIDAGDECIYVRNLEEKLKREKEAAERIFGLLPEKERGLFVEIWEDFEGGESSEAKFVRGLDRLQPLLSNFLNEGYSWRNHDVTPDRVYEMNRTWEKSSAEISDFAHRLVELASQKGYFGGNVLGKRQDD